MQYTDLPPRAQYKVAKAILEFKETGNITCLKPLGRGSYRQTFVITRDFILKVNRREDDSNISEARAYERNPEHKAACFVIPDTDGKLLVMERLRRTELFARLWERRYNGAKNDPRLPDWLKRGGRDRWQVGYNKKGEVVQYDYQDNLGYNID